MAYEPEPGKEGDEAEGEGGEADESLPAAGTDEDKEGNEGTAERCSVVGVEGEGFRAGEEDPVLQVVATDRPEEEEEGGGDFEDSERIHPGFLAVPEGIGL